MKYSNQGASHALLTWMFLYESPVVNKSTYIHDDPILLIGLSRQIRAVISSTSVLFNFPALILLKINLMTR